MFGVMSRWIGHPAPWQGVEVYSSEPGLRLQVFRRFFRARTLVKIGGSDNSRDLAHALTELRCCLGLSMERLRFVFICVLHAALFPAVVYDSDVA